MAKNTKPSTVIGKALDEKGIWQPTLKEFFAQFTSKVKAYFKQLWDESDHDLLEFSIAGVEQLKKGLESGDVQKVLAITGSTTDNKIVAAVNESLPKILETELLIKALGDNATKEEAEATGLKILEKWGVVADTEKEKFFVNVSAEIYRIAMDLKHGQKPSLGGAIAAIKYLFDALKKKGKV